MSAVISSLSPQPLQLHLWTSETTAQLRVTAANTEEDMVSIKATVMVITLLTFCLLVANTSAVSGYHGCCRSYMKTKLPFRAIKGYSIQTVTEMCPINAIIFHTKKGKTCTNPALDWVMDYVNRVRNMAQKVHVKTSQEQK